MLDEFLRYLKIERGFSENSILAYREDTLKLLKYLKVRNIEIINVTYIDLNEFINYLSDNGVKSRTLARIISGIKAFFKFMEMETYIENDASELLEAPKISKKLPDVLSIEEIDNIVKTIDLSKPEGERNRAILEILYGCGLRVSELINLRLSDLYFEEGFVKILGKGNKERLVPISDYTKKYINIYLENSRVHIPVKKEYKDILFLNRRGSKLTRAMIFKIIKDLVEQLGLKKNISPHTFRHSFATHILDGGVSIISIQQMLGHEDVTTTEVYLHISQKKLRKEIMKYHPRKK